MNQNTNMQQIISGMAAHAESINIRKQNDLLVRKWKTTGLLEGLSDFQSRNMSRMLTNEAFELRKLNEDSVVSGIAGFNKIAFPLVRRSFGRLLANELVSVQPMTQPAGLIFYIDYQFDVAKPDYATAGGSVFGTRETVVNQALQGTGAQTGQGALYNLGGGYSRRYFKLTTAAPTNSTVTASSTLLNATVSGYDFTLSLTAATDMSALWGMRIALSGECASDGLTFRGLSSISSLTANSLVSVVDPSLTQTVSGGNVIRIFSSTNLALAAASAQSTVVLLGPASTIVTNAPQVTLLGDFEGIGTIPEVNLVNQSIPVYAETRKLKAAWTPELAQDMSAFADVDAEVELTTVLSELISLEIDNSIQSELLKGAAVKSAWSAKIGKQLKYNTSNDTISVVNFSTDSSFGTGGQGYFGDYSKWYETLLHTINNVSAEIYKRTHKFDAKYIVASPIVCALLENINGYKSIISSSNNNSEFEAAFHKVGELVGKFHVYKNAYFPVDIVLVGARGSGFSDSGYVYAPYIPLIVSPTIYGVEDFTPRKAVTTRGATQMIRPEFYGVVKILDLDAVSGYSLNL